MIPAAVEGFAGGSVASCSQIHSGRATPLERSYPDPALLCTHWNEDGWGSSPALDLPELLDEQVDDDPDTNEGQDKRDPDPGRTAFPAPCKDTSSPHLPLPFRRVATCLHRNLAEASPPVNLMKNPPFAHLCTAA